VNRITVLVVWILAGAVSLLALLHFLGAGIGTLAEWALLFAAAVGLSRLFKTIG
jgi:ABC-type dipeptide/oligopeptide/nickel transport system permease subunit